jgi:hypothetical protein
MTVNQKHFHLITLKPDFEVMVVSYVNDTVKFSPHSKPPFQLLFCHGSTHRRIPVLLERKHVKLIKKALKKLPDQVWTPKIAYLVVAGCAVTHLRHF